LARVAVSKCEQGIDEKKILSTINTSFYLSQFHPFSPIFTTWNDTGNDTQKFYARLDILIDTFINTSKEQNRWLIQIETFCLL